MSFVQSYCTAFAGENTDPLFNRACALFALSTGLQRRVWTRSGNKYTFPNLYMLLVANSGAGKGEALDPLKSLVSTMKDGTIHLAAASVTAASLADALQKALVTYVSRKGVSHQYHALTIISDEFGVFIPEYDKIKLARLTHLYDQKGYSETTRGGVAIEIEKSSVAMLGACTPAWLANTLPPNAWEEGFMSRVFCVHGYEPPPRPLTQGDEGSVVIPKTLIAEFRKILNREGQIFWSEDGLAAINAWITGGYQPVPHHPRLISYQARRRILAIKFSMLFAVARHAEKIEAEDFQSALDIMVQCEERMPDIFKAMSSGGDDNAIKELLHIMAKFQLQHKKPPTEQLVLRVLGTKLGFDRARRVFDALRESHKITSVPGGYVPGEAID